MFECPYGRIDGQQPPCISNEQRCDNVTDCVGGEDEYCGCEEGDVRLVDGSGPYEGRVEFCSDGSWKTVCHNQWDINEAAVVCRQLGYPSESTQVTNNFVNFELARYIFVQMLRHHAVPDLVQDTLCYPLNLTTSIALDKRQTFLSVGELVEEVVDIAMMLASFAVKLVHMILCT